MSSLRKQNLGNPLHHCLTLSFKRCISPSLFFLVSLARCISHCLSAPFRLLFLPPKLLWVLLNIQSLNCFHFYLTHHLPSECPALYPYIISSPLLPSACILPSCPHRPILQLWITFSSPTTSLLQTVIKPRGVKPVQIPLFAASEPLPEHSTPLKPHSFLGGTSNPAKTQIRTQTHGLTWTHLHLSLRPEPMIPDQKGLELLITTAHLVSELTDILISFVSSQSKNSAWGKVAKSEFISIACLGEILIQAGRQAKQKEWLHFYNLKTVGREKATFFLIPGPTLCWHN